MSYYEPKSWTDVDAAGKAVYWPTPRNTLLYPRAEMLRRAVVERCDPVGETVTGILGNVITPKEKRLSDDFKTAIQTTMTAIIQKYVNYTVVVSNFDGYGPSEIPLWTVSDILTAIGATERLNPSIPTADWINQQYDMLNLLKWVLKTSSIGIPNNNFLETGGRTGTGKGATAAGAYAKCLADYNSNSWTSSSGRTQVGSLIGKSYNAGSPTGDFYSYSMTNVRAKLQETTLFLLPYSVDLYIYQIEDGNGGLDEFWSGDGYIEKTAVLYDSISNITNNHYVARMLELAPPFYSGVQIEENAGAYAGRFGYTNVYPIYKFEDSFKFIS